VFIRLIINLSAVIPLNSSTEIGVYEHDCPVLKPLKFIEDNSEFFQKLTNLIKNLTLIFKNQEN
jgi:hypothetical protein